MQISEKHICYAAFKAKDTRFDGCIFVGILSTGIYCRPVCKAKLAKIENCTFYATAAAAEQAGYRPCLLCRPELAPGNATIDATATLVHKAAKLLEENCADGQSINAFAQQLGYSERHLRRAFTAAFKVPPVQYLQTCRLLLAKNLLTDTELSVTDVAMASGFGSLRRFNDLFKTQYRLSPTTLRKQTATHRDNTNQITLMLGYRPPYQWAQILSFLALRAIPGVEVINNDSYLRTVCYLSDRCAINGWLRVGHRLDKNALTLTISSTLLPALPHIIARVRNLFDLSCDPRAVYETLSVMNQIMPDLCIQGIRLPGCFDPFEMAVRAILGQQITVKAARTLAGRLAQGIGAPVETGIEGLSHTFPSAQTFTNFSGDISQYLGSLGIIGSRARTIICLARKITDNQIDFTHVTQPEAEINKLMSIPGIGLWTAHYIAMRAMNWPDAFPHTDLGIKKALAPMTTREILSMAEAWRPWRSYATINLWRLL